MSEKAVELINQGVSPQSIFDACWETAGELLMRKPGIATLHAVTSTNALHYAFQHTTNDETRRFLLLQNAIQTKESLAIRRASQCIGQLGHDPVRGE